MDKQQLIFRDLGVIDYKSGWDYQEKLLLENVDIKTALRKSGVDVDPLSTDTKHYLLLCEHPPVSFIVF